MSALPLQGTRVLDLSRLYPGPYATLVLADLGADVVKVEDPGGGDYLRWMPPLAGEQSGWFHALNRNKRSLALDLRRPEGPAALLRLARSFDVVVESFRPGVLDRLGVGWEALSRENPRLVLCSISGYGQDGPYRDRAGHDIDYVALAGVLAVNGPPERPVPLGVQVGDVAGGAWPAVTGILAALLGRQATGKGAWIDVAMAEGALAMLALQQGAADAEGRALRRGGEQLNGGSACYRVYRAKDGGFVALGALEPKFFKAFCEAVGRPDLADRQFDREGDVEGPVEEVAAVFASRTRAEWAAFAGAHDVCVMPVLEGDEPRRDPQLAHRRSFVDVPTPWAGRSMPGIASPVRLRGVEAPLRPAPRLGEDGEAVLAESGFTPGEIAALRASGVLG
ncbi:MAG TPA: CaiB/BaiF CoA-transferase family protein [Anaeromyxobacteraceae bacterium]|nr:CaiB/BaiF CoA-transferase family protein [Anaeromyxobacteraceae bacterium]